MSALSKIFGFGQSVTGNRDFMRRLRDINEKLDAANEVYMAVANAEAPEQDPTVVLRIKPGSVHELVIGREDWLTVRKSILDSKRAEIERLTSLFNELIHKESALRK